MIISISNIPSSVDWKYVFFEFQKWNAFHNAFQYK